MFSQQYEVIMYRLKKLASHPNAALVKDFLDEYLFTIRMPGVKHVNQEVGSLFILDFVCKKMISLQ